MNDSYYANLATPQQMKRAVLASMTIDETLIDYEEEFKYMSQKIGMETLVNITANVRYRHRILFLCLILIISNLT